MWFTFVGGSGFSEHVGFVCFWGLGVGVSAAVGWGAC